MIRPTKIKRPDSAPREGPLIPRIQRADGPKQRGPKTPKLARPEPKPAPQRRVSLLDRR